MMHHRRPLTGITFSFLAALFAGCGGGATQNAGLQDAGMETGLQDGRTQDGTTPTEGGTGTPDAADDGGGFEAGADSAVDAAQGMEASVDGGMDSSPGQPCPDETGTYTVAISGAGCGDLMMSATQSITAGASVCQVKLVSQGAGGTALNATVTLDDYGNFSGGAVQEGTGQRTGCTGTWKAGASQLTVDCGGTMSSQSCIATLTRTGKDAGSPPPPCPDETGAYTVSTMGAGCSNLAAGAPQCIKAGASSCQIQLVSQGAGGSALNATGISLDMSGNFTGGAVTEGTVMRTGCTGAWSAGSSQLTVDCGGMMTSQSCIATLTRTGTTCP
jgi:hypothetical protein